MLEEEKTEVTSTAKEEENPQVHSDGQHKNPKGIKPNGKRTGNRSAGPKVSPYETRVVSINRVSKTVKGGRRMKFTALVVLGDKNKKGYYGFASAKAAEVPDAIKKAEEAAKKNMFYIHITTNSKTITHEVIGKFGACSVLLKPAPAGTGIVAGGPVRAILELAGIENVCSKVYGSRSAINVIRATHQGLQSLKTYDRTIAIRGKKGEDKSE